MVKSIKKIPWTNIALVVGLGFAWTKLGLGAAVKEFSAVGPVIRIGAAYMTQAQWEAAGLGYGSSDYEDWLRGQ